VAATRHNVHGALVSQEHQAGTHACDCAVHGHASKRREANGWWSMLLPALACAVCPACLATYAQLLSMIGISVALSETQHLSLMVLALATSVLVSAWRAQRIRSAWPIVAALSGASLMLTGHLLAEAHWLEWTGVLVLLGGGLAERFLLRSPALSASRRLLQ
jgi:hypothetical protein